MHWWRRNEEWVGYTYLLQNFESYIWCAAVSPNTAISQLTYPFPYRFTPFRALLWCLFNVYKDGLFIFILISVFGLLSVVSCTRNLLHRFLPHSGHLADLPVPQHGAGHPGIRQVYKLKFYGWDLAEWWMKSSQVGMRFSRAVTVEHLAVDFKFATVPCSIPATSDTVESEGRQMKQCWITYNRTYMKKNKLK